MGEKAIPSAPPNSTKEASGLHRITMEALKSSSALRKGLQIGGPIVGTSVAGLMQLASKFTQDTLATVLNTGSGVIAICVVAIAILLALTDKNGPDALREAYASNKERVKAELSCAQAQADAETAASQTAAIATLYATSIALREFIQPVLADGPGNADARAARMAALLDILLSNKAELFEIADERWNLSIYLANADRSTLECVACRRRDRADEEGEHRAWPVGVGQVGLAFREQAEFVVSDVKNPDFAAYFRASPELQRSDDSDRYRSIAAVPVAANGTAHGVVIATSDIPGRFAATARSNGQRDTVEPLRVLAGVLVILLAATDMHQRLGATDA